MAKSNLAKRHGLFLPQHLIILKKYIYLFIRLRWVLVGGTQDLCCHVWDLHCGIWDLVPCPGIEPNPEYWQCGVLTTGPPEKSPFNHFYSDYWIMEQLALLVSWLFWLCLSCCFFPFSFPPSHCSFLFSFYYVHGNILFLKHYINRKVYSFLTTILSCSLFSLHLSNHNNIGMYHSRQIYVYLHLFI